MIFVNSGAFLYASISRIPESQHRDVVGLFRSSCEGFGRRAKVETDATLEADL